MAEFPKIISVDDHVIEPADVWTKRLPAKYQDVGPRVVRQKIAEMQYVGGVFSYREAGAGEDGDWCDWWFCEDLRYPMTRVMAAAGFPRDEVTVTPITMDDMRPGCHEQKARLEDMDANWTHRWGQPSNLSPVPEARLATRLATRPPTRLATRLPTRLVIRLAARP